MCCIVPNNVYLCVIKVNKQLKNINHEKAINNLINNNKQNTGRKPDKHRKGNHRTGI